MSSETTLHSQNKDQNTEESTVVSQQQQQTRTPELVTVEISNRSSFTIPSYYSIDGPIGKGAYGDVVAAINTITNEKVAIKKCANVFNHDKEYIKRILREIKILKHFRDHENIVSLMDLIPPVSFSQFNDVYIVMDLMDTDLRSIIRSQQELSDSNIQYFIYQILRGLKYIHSANVLHRDIKPSNILVSAEMDVKLCDFGLSRAVDFENDPTMSTPYVATRWYRAPELLLMWDKTSRAMDIWSVGCILAEMLDQPKPKRRVLFPGKNYLNQIDLILDVVGTPKESEIRGCSKGKQYMKTRPYRPKKDWKTLFPEASCEALDLLDKMLQFDPMKRITTEEALMHPYLADMHDPSDEPVCETAFDFQYAQDMSEIELKEQMFVEVMRWNREMNSIHSDTIVSQSEGDEDGIAMDS